jgi:two-component system, OmpR family, sensor histidine kinase TctE
MIFPDLSIHRRLLLGVLLPNLILWLATVATAFYVSRKLTDEAYDEVLIDGLLTLATRVHDNDGRITLDLPSDVAKILQETPGDVTYYQLVGPGGELVSGEQDFPAALHASENVSMRVDTFRSMPVRVAAKALFVPSVNGYAKLQFAETLSSRNLTAGKTMAKVIVPMLVLLVCMSILLWFGIKSSLAPLEHVRSSILERSLYDSTPLPEAESPVEVRPLVHAINDLLARHSEDYQQQRRFLANAAHQLRTPLAGLKTQVDLALLKNKDEALEHVLGFLEKAIARLSRLVKQLLALARAEPSSESTTRWEMVDIEKIARDATNNFVQAALLRDLELEFIGTDEPQIIRGNAGNLSELVSNLVDNAVIYTPRGGKVSVAIARAGDDVLLTVEDTGPGIPEAERAAVFERFYRLETSNVEGSGLGLAIVKEIVQIYGGTIELRSGSHKGGLLVKITLPLVCAEASGKRG